MHTFALSAEEPHSVTPPSLRQRLQTAPAPAPTSKQPSPTLSPNIFNTEAKDGTASAELMPVRFRAESDPPAPGRFDYLLLTPIEYILERRDNDGCY